MENGISIYPGLDNTLEENLTLIQKARELGLKRLFTSLHIPETDVSALKQEIGTLLQAARRHGMEVISDVSPATCQLLDLPDFNPTSFRMLGITTLRLDYGFSAEEIARLTHRFPEMRFHVDNHDRRNNGKNRDPVLFRQDALDGHVDHQYNLTGSNEMRRDRDVDVQVDRTSAVAEIGDDQIDRRRHNGQNSVLAAGNGDFAAERTALFYDIFSQSYKPPKFSTFIILANPRKNNTCKGCPKIT